MADLKLREEKRLNNRRKHPRFETQLKAQFVSAESQRGGEDCAIIDFNRKGMRAKVYSSEEINVGTNVLLEVFIPRELDPIHVKGAIKWVKQIENGFICGIELSKGLEGIKLSKLQLCSIRYEIDKEEKTKLHIVSKGHALTLKSSQDRFIPFLYHSFLERRAF
ncbi:MAG: PilZ domain-containing protein [Deltaproteobacteria bacterium]|nr:PilZ domain-containing protein [Deltaproteobacteria bacterium]